jgi:hypothetical protein
MEHCVNDLPCYGQDCQVEVSTAMVSSADSCCVGAEVVGGSCLSWQSADGTSAA